MMIKYFAIRKRSTGDFLPNFGRRRGHTHAEPVPLESSPPRLFNKRSAAVAALRYWLQGHWYERHYTTYFGEWECDGPMPSGKPERKAEDMEVIEVNLSA